MMEIDIIDELKLLNKFVDPRPGMTIAKAIFIIEKYRDALRLISVEAACEGPGCSYCEREDEIHPFTAVAKVAQEALKN